MGLSVIIVNYKTAGLVLDCLESFLSANKDFLSEVIIIDNHSNDDLALKLKVGFPGVVMYDMGYNAGFARANNVGIRMATGDAVLLLNADTVVKNSAISDCYRRLMDSEYVAAGVQLLNPDLTPQISGNFVMKGGLNYLLPLPYVGRMLRSLAFCFGAKSTNIPEATKKEEVDWINGAFLMVKKAVIENAGLLDEDFFLYAEEAEWCHRIKKIGKLCIYGDLHIIHLQGASSKDAFGSNSRGYQQLSDKKGLQIMVSNFLRIRKEFGVFWLLIQLFGYLSFIPIALFFGILDLSIIKNKDIIRRWIGLSSNIVKTATLVPRMILGKPYFYKML